MRQRQLEAEAARKEIAAWPRERTLAAIAWWRERGILKDRLPGVRHWNPTQVLFVHAADEHLRILSARERPSEPPDSSALDWGHTE